MRKKLLIVFGTRPEAIKLFPLIRELRGRQEVIMRICVSAQHRELLDSTLREFNIVPDVDLNIMKKDQTLFDITHTLLPCLREVLCREMPDAVIVHGDTTTAYVAALCAFYLSIPVFHVEAGLRSGSIRAPFPEEFNRRAISLVSELHFAPTKEAEENLLREGVDEKNIVVTGNTAIDSLRYTLREDYSHPYLAWARKKKLILLTCHRRESFGAPMREIFCAVRRVCRQRKDVCVLFPAHPSPTVRKIAREIFSDCASVRLVEPLGAVDFHNILSRCYAAATDSGGIQEEASALHIPTLVLRERTERAEGVRSGGLLLGGIREEEVFDALTRLLDSRELYQKMSHAPCPFGDGYSSRRIADEITKRLR